MCAFPVEGSIESLVAENSGSVSRSAFPDISLIDCRKLLSIRLLVDQGGGCEKSHRCSFFGVHVRWPAKEETVCVKNLDRMN